MAPPGATTKGSAPQRSTRRTVGLGKRVVTTTGLGRAVVVAAVAFACSLHALRPFLYSDAPSPEQEERCNVRTIDVSAMPPEQLASLLRYSTEPLLLLRRGAVRPAAAAEGKSSGAVRPAAAAEGGAASRAVPPAAAAEGESAVASEGSGAAWPTVESSAFGAEGEAESGAADAAAASESSSRAARPTAAAASKRTDAYESLSMVLPPPDMSFASLDAFVALHGSVPVEVVTSSEGGFTSAGGGFTSAAPLARNDHRAALVGHVSGARLARMSVAAFAAHMRNGTANDAYSFTDVRRTAILDSLPSLSSLASLALLARHAPAHWTDAQRRAALHSPELRGGALHGGAYLAMGARDSGGALHAHTDAMLGLLVGQKLWIVSKPKGAGGQASRGAVARDLLRDEADGASYWRCVQRAGEVFWVPHGLAHTVLNLGESVGVSMQETVVASDLLCRAAYNNDANAVPWLMATGGMDPNRQVATPGAEEHAPYTTAMHEAARGDAADAVAALVAGGAAIDAHDGYARSPLHMAATSGHVAVIEALMSHGAAVDELDGHGHTPLHAAALAGNANAIDALLQRGARVDAVSSVGQTPLMYAAIVGTATQASGTADAVRALLDGGAGDESANAALILTERELGEESEAASSGLREAQRLLRGRCHTPSQRPPAWHEAMES